MQQSQALSLLTPRERDVVYALACSHGRTKGAALLLGMSPFTLRNHRNAILSALEARNIIDAFVVLGWMRVPAEAEKLQHSGRHNPRPPVLLPTISAETLPE